MPLISVVTPAYNSEHFIRECIASVAAQAFSDWEMIVVDDGSIDGTAQVVAGFSSVDSRIRLVSKSNGGVSSARNAGLEAAHGRYVVFLDSDDEMPPYAMTAYAASIAQSCSDVVQGIALRIDASGNEASRIAASSLMSRASTAEEAIEALSLIDKAPLLHYIWNKAYKRDLLDAVQARFDESVSLGEDFIFNCQVLSAAGLISFVDADVCRYIQRAPVSLTRRFRPEELIRRRKMEGAFRGLLESFGQWEAKKSLYDLSVGAIAMESVRSVALPDCCLAMGQKCEFVRSFYDSEYRGHVEVYVDSGDCTSANRMLGRVFLMGRPGLFVALCSFMQKMRGLI